MYYMWRVTAALWLTIWCFTFFPVEVRIATTFVIALLQFIHMYSKRMRLYRIEVALIGQWSWKYVPFMLFNALLNVLIVSFTCVSLHAISAFNLWSYGMSHRRVDLCVFIVLGVTCYTLERIVWDSFFTR